MIGRRSKRGRDRDEPTTGEPRDAALFNLEELHEKRIHSWSPEPHEDDAPGSASPGSEPVDPGAGDAPAPSAVRDVEAPRRRPTAPAAPAARLVEAPAEKAPGDRTEPVVSASSPAEPHPDPERPARRRGRPRGRPRRQVHFHVDPDEERLLMAAVETYGSQQKGLVAALHALQETERLRLEIERLRAECERQRELLDQAQSLFKQ